MKDLFWVVLAVFSFIQLGLVADYYLIAKRKVGFKPAVYFGLGVGVITILNMFASMVSIPLDNYAAFAVFFAVCLPFVFDRRLAKDCFSAVADWVAVIGKNRLLTGAFLVFVAVIVIYTFGHVPWGDDAYERWLAKAGAFYLDGRMTSYSLYLSEPADDPNLWPITVSWLYRFIGEPGEFWSQTLQVAVFVLIIFEFARRVTILKSGIKLFWLIILALTPMLWNYVVLPEYSGNADLFLSFYFILAFGALVSGEIIYAALFFGLAVLTKNDAIPALATLFVLIPLLALNQKDRKPFLAAAALGLAIFIFNIIWKMHFDLGNRFLQRDIGEVLAQRPFFAYQKYALMAYREEFRNVAHWGAGWLVIFFVFVTKFGTILKNRLILAAFLIFGVQLVAYMAVWYLAVPDHATEIATNIHRLLLGIYPAMLLVCAFVFLKKTSK